MEEDQHEFWEILTKDREEFREIFIRDHEEHRKQIAQMMQILKRMVRKKGIVDNDNSVDTVVLT